MADEAVINRVIRLNTEDFKYSAHLGVFAGRIEISVFENAVKSAPIIKNLFTSTSAYQLTMIMEKVIADLEAKPIELGIYPFDRDLKVAVFKSSITVGRDTEKCIYFDLAGEKHKDPIRFLLVTDKSSRINGMELPKQSLTETGAKTIVKLLDKLMGLALTVPAIKQNQGESGTSTYVPPPSGEDVPFNQGTF